MNDNEKNPLEAQSQPSRLAAVSSRFNFEQEVWFLNGRHIMNGKIIAIKGQKHYLYTRSDIEIKVHHISGEMGCNFWVKEEDCFGSRQELVDTILNGSSFIHNGY